MSCFKLKVVVHFLKIILIINLKIDLFLIVIDVL